jgi:general secretion pathway protein G
MVVLNFSGRADDTRRRVAKGDIASYTTAIDLYALDHNDKLPQALSALAGGARSYVKELNKDPWGNDYVYKVNGAKYDIFSAGADGQPGTADDITSSTDVLSVDEETKK